jgi:hypothetical protein
MFRNDINVQVLNKMKKKSKDAVMKTQKCEKDGKRSEGTIIKIVRLADKQFRLRSISQKCQADGFAIASRYVYV